MAFITYPLNMDDYTAEDAELFHCTRNSGIYADNDFQCIASGVDNTITVGEGIGWIRNSKYSGKVFANKTAEVIDLGLADASLPRYDVIAIQFNKAQNLTKIVVKNGIPASSPTIPKRSVTESIYELYLCKVYRPVGALTITADNVTDTRLDPALCGIMADSVTSIDTSAIDTQVKALIDNLEAEIQGIKDSSGLMYTSDWVEDGKIPIDKVGINADNAEEARENLGAAENKAFIKSGSGAKAGLVPAPSTTAGITKYLREDGTWQVPSCAEKSAITLFGEGAEKNIDIFEAGRKFPVPATGILTNKGDGFIKSSDVSIRATRDMFVEISGNIYISAGLQAGDTLAVQLNRWFSGDDDMPILTLATERAYGALISISIPPVVLQVKEYYSYDLLIYNSTGGRGTLAASPQTRFTIREI